MLRKTGIPVRVCFWYGLLLLATDALSQERSMAEETFRHNEVSVWKVQTSQW
jgi:hypothetical protein